MQKIVIDGRKFIARKVKAQGCRGCTFDTVGDCALKALTCDLPLGHIWRETALSRFRALYAEAVAGEDHARIRYEGR